jgi:hypothetical protein
MGRPVNVTLKHQIKTLFAAGKTIEEVCEATGLARNTVFFHAKEDGIDKRKKYTATEKAALAAMTDEELQMEAAKSGRSYIALARVAARERELQQTRRRERILTVGYFDYFDKEDLRMYGLTILDVVRANAQLAKYGLELSPPMWIKHKSGKYQQLSAEDQRDIVLDPDGFIQQHAGRLAQGWKQQN